MTEFRIEFDRAKDEQSWKKHKIRFATAALVFADPYRIERLDDSMENPGEERWQTLGKVGSLHGKGQQYQDHIRTGSN